MGLERWFSRALAALAEDTGSVSQDPDGGSRGFNALWLLKASGTAMCMTNTHTHKIRINLPKIIKIQSDLLRLGKGLTVCTLR